jgi:hypothetical protein
MPVGGRDPAGFFSLRPPPEKVLYLNLRGRRQNSLAFFYLLAYNPRNVFIACINRFGQPTSGFRLRIL